MIKNIFLGKLYFNNTKHTKENKTEIPRMVQIKVLYLFSSPWLAFFRSCPKFPVSPRFPTQGSRFGLSLLWRKTKQDEQMGFLEVSITQQCEQITHITK